MRKIYDDYVIKSANHIFPDSKVAVAIIEKSFNQFSNCPDFETSGISDTFRKLFVNSEKENTLPGESLRLNGSQPNTNIDLYRMMNGKTIQNVPGIIIIDQAYAFARIYNYKAQDRSELVAKIAMIDFGKKLLPWLIAFLCLRNTFSFGDNYLSFSEGRMTLSFISLENNFSSSASIPKNIAENPYFRILVDGISLVSKSEMFAAFKSSDLEIDDDSFSSVLSFSFKPSTQFGSSDIYSRIVTYLETVGGASKKEMSNYFGISERMMNYHLQTLIQQNRILRIGSLTSPKLIYKVHK